MSKIGQNYRALKPTFVCVSAAIVKNNILHINKHQTGFDVGDDKRVVKTGDTATLDREHLAYYSHDETCHKHFLTFKRFKKFRVLVYVFRKV